MVATAVGKRWTAATVAVVVVMVVAMTTTTTTTTSVTDGGNGNGHDETLFGNLCPKHKIHEINC